MKPYPNTRPLRSALIGNALFSSLSALVMITRPDWVGAWLGISAPLILPLLGVGLLLFAADLLHQATRPRMASWRALYASSADFLWVLASLILVMTNLFSPEGKILVLTVAAAVLGMGIWQLWGIHRLHRLATGDYRHCLQVAVAAPPGAMWQAISQLGDIQCYMPMLKSSHIRDNLAPGVGAVRVCANHSGKQWAEECIGFDPGREVRLRFLASEPDFPFPVKHMTGGWRVSPLGDHTEVTIWWELAPRKPWLAPVILAMLSLGADRTFPGALARMANGPEPTAPPVESRLLAGLC